MSMIIVVPVLLPLVTGPTWPILMVAIGATAAVMGYQAVKNANEAEDQNSLHADHSVLVEVPNADEVGGQLAVGASLSFAKDGVTVTFVRDTQGKISVKVEGHGKTDAELTRIGTEMAHGLVQQYAYHRIVTEMKERGMNVVGEEVDTDGTVRLQVRVFQ